VELLAQGLTDKEIAARVGISDETVATHLKRLFARFRVHSRLG
jgi:DNA-binding CsgD family transcriptional regulator